MLEADLIKHIIKKIGSSSVGDDAGFFKLSANKYLLLTCDSLVEDSHFKKDWFKPSDLGRKAALINLSDIAAMGGKPLAALVSLGLPKNLNAHFIDSFYTGLLAEFKKYKVKVSGGNLAKSDHLFIDVFLMGEVKSERLVLRSGARPGDLLLTTGFLGEAGLGLKLLEKGGKDSPSVCLQKFFIPQPRMEMGKLLGKSKLATAMMDISDGLSGDLLKLCQASRVGVELELKKLPVSKAGEKAAKKLGVDVHQAAFTYGEDYELLFTCKKKNLDKVKQISQTTGIRTTVIGRIKPFSFGQRVKVADKLKPFKSQSWDHFA